MSEKNKAILIVNLIILILAASFLSQGIKQHSRTIDGIIQSEERDIDATIFALRELSFAPYTARLRNLIATNNDIVEAFASRDRNLLYKKTLPKYEALKSENRFLHVMHFHLPDSTTFLRMHRPEFFGDNLKNIRPIVDAVHHYHIPFSGFEIGRHGPYYRIVYPIFLNDKYIGALEIGISTHHFLELLRDKIKLEAIPFFLKNKWQKTTSFSHSETLIKGDYVLLAHGNPLYKKLPDDLFTRHDNLQLELNSKTHIVHLHPLFTDFRGKSIGGVLILHDISNVFKQKRTFIIQSLAFTIAILFLTFSVLYLSFGKLINAMDQEIKDRKKAQTALRSSEKRYRLLFDSAPDSIDVLNEKGIIIDCNEGKTILTGHSREELIGKHVTELFALEDIPKFQKNFPILKSLHPTSYECNLIKKDGSTVHVWRKGTPLSDDKGKFIGVLAYDRDITEKKIRAQEKKAVEEKLRRAQKMEAIGLMAGGVAHDLNNILSGIVNYPELLLMDLPEDSPMHKPLKTIQDAGMRAAAIVADMLTVARGIASSMLVTNINTILENFFSSAEFFKLKGMYPLISFSRELDPGLFNIKCSPLHIKKIVMNLLTNGAEAINEKGQVIITTQNRYLDQPLRGYDEVSKGEYCVLSVTDSGTGISDADLDRIFEPFYTKKVMGRSGTGLGLAVVWNTMQDHNGYIDIKRKEKCTRFDLFFPITRESVTASDEEVEFTELNGNKELILIVDDEENQRDIAGRLLEKLNYRTVALVSGEEAVEYLRTEKVDLIILDMIMSPGMNGRQTYEQIIEMHPGQKAIIASGYSENEEVKKTQQLGAGRYIKKPYTLAQIGQAVKDELSRSTD